VFQHENSRKPLEPPVVAEFVKGSKPGPGHRTVFSEDFGLEEYDSVAYNKPLAGSHSGFVTTLRIAKANDRLYQKGSYLFQYEGVYRFNAVPNTPLMRGQVTARGVLYGTLDSKGNFTPLNPVGGVFAHLEVLPLRNSLPWGGPGHLPLSPLGDPTSW
jgi:hypothetical protein